MNGLPMTADSSVLATAPVAIPLSRDAAAVPAPPAHPGAELKPVPAVAATATTTAPPPSFPVSLQFDQATHRFFIEARDSSGLVVFQVPFKSAVGAPAASTVTRGQRFNSKA